MCFKPCYKWITFNTNLEKILNGEGVNVLNLVINGLPSILKRILFRFYRKSLVLNLVINGLPSILDGTGVNSENKWVVLNLVINGLPSIHRSALWLLQHDVHSFKPCYKWITFNTHVRC